MYLQYDKMYQDVSANTCVHEAVVLFDTSIEKYKATQKQKVMKNTQCTVHRKHVIYIIIGNSHKTDHLPSTFLLQVHFTTGAHKITNKTTNLKTKTSS